MIRFNERIGSKNLDYVPVHRFTAYNITYVENYKVHNETWIGPLTLRASQ